MTNDVVAIIPARGGSKRIPRKNIKPFLGVPLIARTIACIAAAGACDRIVVSTDDEEIATVARDAGAEVPFLRPAELADDYSSSRSVIQHAIGALEAGEPLRAACVVYATAALLAPADLAAASRVFAEEDVDFAVSVSTYEAPVQRALRIRPDGCGEMVEPQFLGTRSQDLEPRYHDAGQFYWGRRDAWMSDADVFSGDVRTRLVVVPRWRAQDIDTPEDWEFAERLFEANAHRQSD